MIRNVINWLALLHYIIPDQISFCSNVFQNFAYVSIIEIKLHKCELKANGIRFQGVKENLSGTKSRVTKIF